MRNIYKHLPLFFLIVIASFSCKNSSKTFFLQGEIEGSNAKKVYLYELLPDEEILVDSSSIINGKFKFNIKQDDKSIYLIEIAETEKINFIAKSGDKLSFKADFLFGVESYFFKNSDENNLLMEMNRRLQNCYETTDTLSKAYKNLYYADDYEAEKYRIDSLYNLMFSEHREWLTDIIVSEKYPFVGLIAFYQSIGTRRFFNDKNDFDILTILHKSLNEKHPQNTHTQSFNSKFLNLKNEIEEEVNLLESLLPGNKTPHFSLFTHERASITNADFVGQNYIIYFWNLISDNSPQYLQNLEIIAQKTPIIAVALEPNMSVWEKLIAKEYLFAINRIEEKAFDSPTALQFNIKETPHFYLINKDDKIVCSTNNIDSLKQYLKNEK